MALSKHSTLLPKRQLADRSEFTRIGRQFDRSDHARRFIKKKQTERQMIQQAHSMTDPVVTGQLTFNFDHANNLFDFLDRWGHDAGFEPNPAAQPTDHEPGSPEKVEVLAQRLLNNEALWHEDDRWISPQPQRLMELMTPSDQFSD